MRVCKIHIDGFGIFHGLSLDDIPVGLSLFLGDNESGKTTLMQFVRTMLFGFPRRGRQEYYPPLRGGNHGGRVHVVMEDGRRFTIERHGREVTVMQDGGAPQATEPSQLLLGGIDRQTFERIFALGLGELQGLDILSQESVRGRILAAGAGLGVTSVPVAMHSLDKELAALLSQRGRKEINKIVASMRRVEAQRRQLLGQSTEYAECEKARDEMEKKIEAARDRADRIRQRLRRIEQLTQAREHWVRLCGVREKRARLDFAKEFPPNGLERLENLNKEIEELEWSTEEKRNEIARFEEELGRITLDEVLLEHEQEIETLAAEREKFASALDDIPGAKSGVARAREEREKRLGELGPGWDIERLRQLDTSVQVRQHVQELGRRLDAFERTHEQTAGTLTRAREAEQEAKRSAEEARRRFEELPAPPITDVDHLRKGREAVRVLRTLVHRRDVLESQREEKRAACRDVEERLGYLQRQQESWAGRVLSWTPLLSLIGGVVLAVVLAVQGSYVPALVVLVIGVVGAGFFRTLSRQLPHVLEQRQHVERLKRAVNEELQSVEKEVATVDENLRRLAHEAHLERPQDSAHLERMAGELDRAAEELHEWRQRKGDEDEAEQKWRTAQEHLGKVEREAERVRAELETARSEWRKWLAERGFLDTIRPDGFEAVLQAVERARDAERNLSDRLERAEHIESYIHATRVRIESLLGLCGREALGKRSGVEDVDAFRKELEDARQAQRRQRELDDKLRTARSELKRLETKLHQKREELKELLAHARAQDGEAFRRLAASHEEWRECTQQIDKEEDAMRTIAGTSEALERIEKELEETDPSRLHAEKDILESDLGEVQTRRSDGEREIGSLTERLGQMASDEQLGELLLEQRSMQEQLDDGVRRWSSFVVCRYLLDQARAVYERERQPRVIQEAGTFLGTMTSSRYRLISPVGESSIRLEDAALQQKEEGTWSSGLADQVYFAVRLGLAREFGSHTEPLPVILDDVLVKFDPSRQLGAAKVILEFSREHQVLLFSCHPELKETLEKARQESGLSDTPVASYGIDDGELVSPPG